MGAVAYIPATRGEVKREKPEREKKKKKGKGSLEDQVQKRHDSGELGVGRWPMEAQEALPFLRQP